jgi:hypothetical protein
MKLVRRDSGKVKPIPVGGRSTAPAFGNRQFLFDSGRLGGGRYRDRTYGPYHVKVVLSR